MSNQIQRAYQGCTEPIEHSISNRAVEYDGRGMRYDHGTSLDEAHEERLSDGISTFAGYDNNSLRRGVWDRHDESDDVWGNVLLG